ncbi:hypothetical protein MNQ98_01415 [Paenibacillus sp. N3/727]|uniref:hypothetical protein n=1 Tax=Paenibacillus sp. N3/727 TaxID=2925845 RepID=UPI001F533E29|nr:hypothetical protein [Paenibacillus sp. N3/727]UNK18732.1 hypothetical protein MNQ98_01415 [Paenibacillus sp. N3/727]
MKNFTKFLSILFAAVIILSGCSSNNAADSQDRSANEKLALSYVTDYHNGTKEDRNKFVDESIHPDVQGKFRVGAKRAIPEDQQLKDPKVAESVAYDDGDTKGSLVLIQSADDKEMIALITENKVYMSFSLENTSQDSYQEIRSSFKTAK